MNLRARSRSHQWKRWLSAALVALAAYVILSYAFFGTVRWNVFQPRAHRLALPIFLAFASIAWELRWDGVVRKKKVEGRNVEGAGRVAVEVEEKQKVPVPSVVRAPCAQIESDDRSERVREGMRMTGDAEGEELYVRAREIPHRPIPNYEQDGTYLDLLGKSAARGYAPALARLGAYAMRRAAWVEAYYWMTLAQRRGMSDSEPVLRMIRQSWSMAGMPDEDENVHALFPPEAGSLGRALLHLDTGRNVTSAAAFLRDHFTGAPVFSPADHMSSQRNFDTIGAV